MRASASLPIDSIQPFVDRGELAGAVVLVASADAVLSLDAIGWADIAARKPMNVDQMFWIASMSKPIAATALMMLVDEGRLSVDDPVEKYLPEFSGQMVEVEKSETRTVLERLSHPISVADTLRHTSGMTFLSRPERTIDLLTLREAIYVAAMTNLSSQPGTKFQYSNCGSNTAARIVEVVGGMPFERFLDERLIRPLGMTDTTWWPTDEQAARLAKTYKGSPDSTALEETTSAFLRYPLQDRTRAVHPAGGLFSTASDVARFCQMILRGGIFDGRSYVTGESIRQMTIVQTGKLTSSARGTDTGYGFGWGTNDGLEQNDATLKPRKFGHNGALSTGMWIYPDHQIAIVYLVQHVGYGGTTGELIYPTLEKAVLDWLPSCPTIRN